MCPSFVHKATMVRIYLATKYFGIRIMRKFYDTKLKWFALDKRKSYGLSVPHTVFELLICGTSVHS